MFSSWFDFILIVILAIY